VANLSARRSSDTAPEVKGFFLSSHSNRSAHGMHRDQRKPRRRRNANDFRRPRISRMRRAQLQAPTLQVAVRHFEERCNRFVDHLFVSGLNQTTEQWFACSG